MLGKIEGKRRRGQQRMRWLDSILNSMDMNFSKLCETVKDGVAWHAGVYRVTKSWTQLSDGRVNPMEEQGIEQRRKYDMGSLQLYIK